MNILKPNSTFFILLFVALFAVFHITNVESKCVSRNFKYPTPNKPATSSSSITTEHSSPSSSSSSSSSSFKVEKETSSKEEKESASSSSQQSSSGSSSGSASASVSGSASGAVDSPDGKPSGLKSRFGDMLKSVVGQINPNSPILNIPKASVNDPEIKKMCGATDYPDLCESTVAHFVDGRHDPVAMLEIAIKACVQYTQMAMTAAKTLSNSPVFARIKTRFNDIAEYYQDALENFQDAANAINAKDMPTVKINLSAALDDFSAYQDDWGETSPMSDFDEKLTHMASNCLAISTLVKFH